MGAFLALSDGVFAFSLTLLVVSLSVPTATSNAALASQLLDQTPMYISYIISFVAVASIWYGHHESFKYIRRYDGRLIALNFGSLFLLSIPIALWRPIAAEIIWSAFLLAIFVLLRGALPFQHSRDR